MDELVIRPPKGLSPIPLKELWRYRDLLLSLGTRDVKLRYRQTALGAAWVVLQPLIGAGLFSFVFGTVAKLPSQGVPYFAFSYAGLLGWSAFSTCLTKASTSLVGTNVNLVSKVYFPRLILPLSVAMGVAVDFGVGTLMLFCLLAAYHIAFSLALLLLPVCFLLAVMMSLGLGLLASAMMVSYRDVQYIVPVAVQFLLYASPIAYSASAVPAHLRSVFAFNPLVGLMEAFRWVSLGTPVSSWYAVGYSAVASVLVFCAGSIAFQNMERRFADVI